MLYTKDSHVCMYVLAIALCLSVCLSVWHKSEFYQNDRTDRADFYRATLC